MATGLYPTILVTLVPYSCMLSNVFGCALSGAQGARCSCCLGALSAKPVVLVLSGAVLADPMVYAMPRCALGKAHGAFPSVLKVEPEVRTQTKLGCTLHLCLLVMPNRVNTGLLSPLFVSFFVS